MSFPDALKEVITGKKITKLEWNNNQTYVVLKDAILCIHNAKDSSVTFHSLIVSEGDLVGEDWVVLELN